MTWDFFFAGERPSYFADSVCFYRIVENGRYGTPTYIWLAETQTLGM